MTVAVTAIYQAALRKRLIIPTIVDDEIPQNLSNEKNYYLKIMDVSSDISERVCLMACDDRSVNSGGYCAGDAQNRLLQPPINRISAVG